MEKTLQVTVEANAMEADRFGGSSDNGGDELEDNSRQTQNHIPNFEELITEIDKSSHYPLVSSNLNKADSNTTKNLDEDNSSNLIEIEVV